MRKCKGCGNEVSVPFNEECPTCGLIQVRTRACVVCGEPLPEGAKRCNECDAYQDWRSHFPISHNTILLLGALFTVLGTINAGLTYLLNLESRTRVKLTGADLDYVYMRVWNTGQKPSVLAGVRLNFGDLPIEEVALPLPEDEGEQAATIIFRGAPVKVRLTIDELELRKRGDHELYTKNEIKQMLDKNRGAPLTVKVDVEESDDAPGGWKSILLGRHRVHTTSDTVPVDTLYTFILGRQSG